MDIKSLVVDTYNEKFKDLPVPRKADRPVCPGCKNPMPVTRNLAGDQWRYVGYGYFCRLKCCEAYANAAVYLKLRSK